jgi:hypothetical protein
MKSKLQAVAFCTVAALSGIGIGVLDTIQHNRQAASQLTATCMTQPHLAECVEREVAARGVRYFFNGQEFRDGNPVAAFGANE